jgi:tetratricopeptide (TPR) repeat protein
LRSFRKRAQSSGSISDGVQSADIGPSFSPHDFGLAFGGGAGLAAGPAAEDAGPHRFLGLALGQLCALDIPRDVTVAQAFERLAGSGLQSASEASAVVLFDSAMPWGDFLASLSNRGGVGATSDAERFLWVSDLAAHHPGEAELGASAAIEAIGRVEVVLPRWADAAALWSPDNCALSRVKAGSVAVRVPPREEEEFVLAANRGLALGVFDGLLAPQAVLGAGVRAALKAWVCGALHAAAAKDPALLGQTCLFRALGHAHCALGEFDEAIQMYQEVVLLLEQGPAGMEMEDLGLLSAVCYADIGEALRRAGRLPQALQLFQRLVDEGAWAGKADSKAEYYMSLGAVLMKQDEPAAALDAFETSLAVHRASDCREPSDSEANCLCMIARALQAQGLLQRARASFEDALGLRRKRLHGHWKTAEALAGLGGVLMQEGNYLHALRRYAEALEMFSTSLGVFHPDTLECMAKTALVHLAVRDTREAIDFLWIVVDKRVAIFGLDDQRTVAAMEFLVRAFDQSGVAGQAASAREKA